MKAGELDVWPPRFWKFHFTTEGTPGVEVAFTDARRFGRVRLVNCPGEDIRKHSPLVENGPDPVVDLDIFTEEYLRGKMQSRRVPIKALLLDQAMISGIGNWVADETLYQAKLHPEQYCDDFGDSEIKTLYESIRYVCQTAVDKLGDSDQFPEDWLFSYRWGKGGKEVTKLPNGDKLAFITVGGRTSCYAPAVQKKTGRVVPGAKAELLDSAVKLETTDVKEGNSKESRKRKPSNKFDEADDGDAKAGQGKTKKSKVKKEPGTHSEVQAVESTETNDGRRRSTRLKN